jgi:dolichol-phosphate mannosyltransferase
VGRDGWLLVTVPFLAMGQLALPERGDGAVGRRDAGPAAQPLRRRYTRTVNVIVLPTYNERENLRHALGRIREVADGHGVQLHTLIVDDNSPDGTGDLADELAREVPDVSVMHRAGKEGLGKAYIAGFREALTMGAERIFEMDADLSHDASYLPHFLRLIDQGADLVLGSRYVKGGGVENWGLSRKIISRGGCLYAQTILGLPLHDLTGGFKCFRRSVLETVDLDTVDTKGYGFQIEMTYRVYKLGFKVVELPIIFVDRKVGESKMSNDIVVEAMKNVWKLRLSGVPARRPG